MKKISFGNGNWRWGNSKGGELLDIDEGGLETYHYYDNATNRTFIEYAQDVTPVLERCHFLRSTSHDAIGVKRGFMQAAIIPDIVSLIWRKKYGINNLSDPDQMKKAKRLLNTEFKKFKTTDKML